MSPAEAALWMDGWVKENYLLDQATAAAHFQQEGGSELTYYDDRGYLCIAKEVLKIFNELDPEGTVYVFGQKHWRKREGYDKPGRRQ